MLIVIFEQFANDGAKYGQENASCLKLWNVGIGTEARAKSEISSHSPGGTDTTPLFEVAVAAADVVTTAVVFDTVAAVVLCEGGFSFTTSPNVASAID